MAFSKTIQLTGSATTSVASTPWIVDGWSNPQSIGTNCQLTGAATYSLQGSYDDFKPQWDLVANTASWESIANFTSLTTSANGSITGGPYTMLRLLIASGTGSITAKFVQAYAGLTN